MHSMLLLNLGLTVKASNINKLATRSGYLTLMHALNDLDPLGRVFIKILNLVINITEYLIPVLHFYFSYNYEQICKLSIVQLG